jgi:hypothetical protein
VSGCLLRRDRQLGDKLQSPGLNGAGLGDLRKGGGRAADANGVACVQAQFVDQTAEGVDGLALRSALGLGFAQRTRGRLGFGDGIDSHGRLGIDKQQFGPSLAQMPFDVVGQHTEQHVRTHTQQPRDHKGTMGLRMQM